MPQIPYKHPIGADQPLEYLTLCGIGYGNSYAHRCLRGNIPLTIGGGGTLHSTPHHTLTANICTSLPTLCSNGVMYSHGNTTIKGSTPLTLCLRGEGEMIIKGCNDPMVSNTTMNSLRLGVCSDIDTLSPVRVYCNDLSPLLPTLANHLPELDGYHNACPSECPMGMPGDTTRFYPHVMGEEPPPSIWQQLQDIELRILQETPITSPYGYHQVWLLADVWYRPKRMPGMNAAAMVQIMYLRNGDGANAPSRHIINRGVFNEMIVYLTQALGMQQRGFIADRPDHSLSREIALTKQWGLRYTHSR